MKISGTQIAIIATVVIGGGLLLFLVSQKSTNIESKYREIVDVFALAKEVGLDEEQFKKDIDSEAVHNTVASDKADAEKLLGTQISTPVIFVDGQQFTEGKTVDEMVSALETNLQTKINAGEKPVVWEFFDFNCIHCYNLETPIVQLSQELGDKIDFQQKYLPFLRSSSTTYAYAAEAANLQGKKTEYSALLFEKIHGN